VLFVQFSSRSDGMSTSNWDTQTRCYHLRGKIDYHYLHVWRH